MHKKNRHILSSVVAAVFYFLFSDKTPDSPPVAPSSSLVMLIDEKNYTSLRSGSWVVMTSDFDVANSTLPIRSTNKYGVLFVDSMKKAQIAASLELNNPSNYVVINTPVDFNAPVYKAVDYFIYYWAVKLKKTLERSASIEQIVECTCFSLLKMASEICRYVLFY